ncbi:MAG: sugar phosphate isomerase/epimerase [Firmicutes bacterium]|nr:sugar phosphate isomerase/epimerase [Bacillota bacterium]
MKKGLFGVQMSTLGRGVVKSGLYEALKTCNEIGYRSLEYSGVPETPEILDTFKKLQADFGYVVAAMGAPVEAMFPGMKVLSTDFNEIVEICGELNCNILRIGMGPIGRFTSKENVLAYCAEIQEYAEKLKAVGIDYYYHTHASDFVRFDDETIIDMLLKNTTMGLELDTHWIQAGGMDPVAVTRKCAGRIRIYHLKDYRMALPTPEASQAARADRNMPNPQYSGIQFAEIGEGTLDNKGCIEAALEGGSEFFMIEQDRCYDRTPFESLKISHDNLVKMGYGDWF